MIFSGKVYWNGAIRDGSLEFTEDGKVTFCNEIIRDGRKGTIIPSFINGHTHVGDSFISSEPRGNLAEIVGPGGFKHRMLLSADENVIMRGMETSIEVMKKTGTSGFLDFRESGMHGAELLHKADSKEKMAVILSRPSTASEGEQLISSTNGFGMSAISDHNFDLLMDLRKICRKNKKIFAIHFSEASEEKEDLALSLSPDLLVHCLRASDEFLSKIGRRGIPVAVTPRSNSFYGLSADYSRFQTNGVRLMLGTDNCMVTVPDLFAEMDFLYRRQRSDGYISPSDIIKMITDRPREFLANFGHHVNSEYLFFPDRFLNEYELILRGGYISRETIKLTRVG
jgi:cytosine/adenosine deaminase-related metal-dependent hydrolase